MRDQLIDETHLARATVTNVLDLAKERGIVTEEDASGHPGRAKRFSINPTTAVAIGIEFSHNRVTTAIYDLAGQQLTTRGTEPHARRSYKPSELDRPSVDRDAHASLDEAAQHIRGLLAETEINAQEQLVGLGIALAGPLDPKTRMLRPMEGPARSSMTDWLEIDVVEQLPARLPDVPLQGFAVGNDAMFAAPQPFTTQGTAGTAPSP